MFQKIVHYFVFFLIFGSCLVGSSSLLAEEYRGEWIWHPELDPQVTNQFTYFRKVYDLTNPPAKAEILFAADANARLIVNGQILRRKVTRYHPDFVRPEKVQIGPYLKSGKNTVLILHHNWGTTKNFQRQEKRRAGVLIQSIGDFHEFNTDTSWRTARALQFIEHEQQIIGVIGDLRIRFPVMIEGGLKVENLCKPSYRESPPLDWMSATSIEEPIWTVQYDFFPKPQREYFFNVQRLIAAGTIAYPEIFDANPEIMKPDVSFPNLMEKAEYRKNNRLTQDWSLFPLGEEIKIQGKPGETIYLIFDFHQPIHGYPVLQCITETPNTAVSFGYCELNVSPYDGTCHIDPKTGKIRTQGVVGQFYGDRYFTAGKGTVENVEFPDERTARYLTIHVTFPSTTKEESTLTLKKLGMIKSQYPIVWKGSFKCGNPRLEQLIELSKIHAEITMSDTYVDTPGREDGQWLEDIRLRAKVAETWFGDSDLRMFTLLHAQECRENGRFLSFAPQSFVKITGWDWGMQWITMLYDEWKWRGIDAKNNQPKPSLYHFADTLVEYTNLLLECVDEEGLFRTNNVFADIRVGSHSKRPEDVSVIVHCWLIERLRQAIVLAQEFGLEDQAKKWERTRQRMIDAFHQRLVIREKGNVSYAADVLDSEENRLLGKSQAAQISVIEAGLFTKEESKKILEVFFPPPYGKATEGIEPWNNPTYLYRALNVLTNNGLGERALAHLLRRCDPYLPFSSTNQVPYTLQGPLGGPLPEYFITHQEMELPKGTACSGQPGDPTGSHGWAAVALLWMHDAILGVTWDHDENGEPGGKVTIAPNTFGLPFVCGHVMTPKGEVFVNWEPGRHRLEVEIPRGVTASIKLPFGDGWSLLDTPHEAKVQQEGKQEFAVRGCGEYVFGL